MNVVLCSAFRNAESYIVRYAAQVECLDQLLYDRGDSLYIIWCEGDSTDNTACLLSELTEWGQCDVFFQHSHGGQDYGSIVHSERFANLAKVWNAIWQRIPQDADAVLFVESDLIWEPATMLALLDNLAYVPCVAPMVMLRREGFAADYFYDTWAFSKDGRPFSTTPPYLRDAQALVSGQVPTELTQIDSAGSCMAIRGDLARQLTWPAEDVVVGVCRQIYQLGGSVWLDPTQKVVHE